MKISKSISVISVLIVLSAAIYIAHHHAQSAKEERATTSTPSPLGGEGGGEGNLLSSSSNTLGTPRSPLQASSPSPTANCLLIAGLTNDLDYQHRLAAIRALDTNLSAADVECLMVYLADPATAKPGNLFDLALKNDTLAVLLRQDHLPENLGPLLVNIVNNKTQDLTWRDYALQVFPAYAKRTVGRVDADNQAIRAGIETALGERGTVLPGTALIAMSRLSESEGLYDTNTVANQARQILSQSASSDPARITAIQILARTDAAGSRDLARTMAHDESRPVLERMSAIAALGRVGQEPDRAWLQELVTRPGLDHRLLAAANFNLKLLAKRVTP